MRTDSSLLAVFAVGFSGRTVAFSPDRSCDEQAPLLRPVDGNSRVLAEKRTFVQRVRFLDICASSCSFHHFVTKPAQRFPAFVIKISGHRRERCQHRDVVRFSHIDIH